MKERKLNNKSFSLVELIIVIAIMVINLVAWSYSYEVYFIVYGYIFAFCEKRKLESSIVSYDKKIVANS